MSADTAARGDPGRRFRLIILLATALFAAWRINLLLFSGSQTSAARSIGILLAVVEIGAAWYLVSNIIRSAAYVRLLRRAPAPPSPSPRRPRVAIIYLACEDADDEALRSLARIRYDGPLTLIVHDNSRTAQGRAAVDHAVAALEQDGGRPVVRLRRPDRGGGKPAAVNWIVEQTKHSHDCFVLMDNDSSVLTADFIPRALARFDDPTIAVVQFRSHGITSRREPTIRRLLASAVDTFDVFVRWYVLTGLMPFLGHNAIVRTDAFLRMHGLAEGILSDDIDFTMRLAMSGQRVAYAPEIVFGERHPASFAAFRRRCQKWSYGCMQILQRHAVATVLSRNLRMTEKLWLIDFACFYAFQSILIPYLLLAFVAEPLLGIGAWSSAAAAGVVGLTVLIGILSPTLAHAAAHGRMRAWARTAWCCALVYGASCFATARGVLEFSLGRAKEWIPTNARRGEGALWAASIAEAAFGLLLFVVPLASRPDILFVPSSHLFLAIFLFSPLVHLRYRDIPLTRRARFPTRRARLLTASMAMIGLLGLAFTIAQEVPPAARARVEVLGDSLHVDGRRFIVHGIHYSPWLPGTGPSGPDPWPGGEVMDRDFALIRSLNVNTILVHDAPREVFERASREGLMVFATFTIDWNTIGDQKIFARRVDQIADEVAALKTEPSILLWSLGNEIPGRILEEAGPDLISSRLRELHDAVAKADPDHPITHQNWPVTRAIPMPFLEVVSFNLYPTWPEEVVARGYGEYIEKELLPPADGRPLIISEFGANTLEASPQSQARTLRDCWREIRSRTSGGIVFAFVDEWWKNYDNPIDPADYWDRVWSPEDPRSHDLDPEEYYGIYSSDRLPKPGAVAVGEMFAPSRGWGQAWLAVPLILLLAYSIYVFRS